VNLAEGLLKYVEYLNTAQSHLSDKDLANVRIGELKALTRFYTDVNEIALKDYSGWDDPQGAMRGDLNAALERLEKS
jgi:hypothetical protein